VASAFFSLYEAAFYALFCASMDLSNKQAISVSKSTQVQALRPEKNEAFNSEMYLRYDLYDQSSSYWLINFLSQLSVHLLRHRH
jgi:hypothetical protein